MTEVERLILFSLHVVLVNQKRLANDIPGNKYELVARVDDMTDKIREALGQ